MIYQPRNVQPSYLSIDGTEDNVFTMEVNTNNYINAYRLYILNWDNTLKYEGPLVTLDDFVYNGGTLTIGVPHSIGLVNGLNYKWYVKLYQPGADIKITYGNVRASGTTTSIKIANNINIKPGMKIQIGNELKEISNCQIGDEYETITVNSPFSNAPEVGTSYIILSNFIQTLPEYVAYVRANPIIGISNMTNSITKKYFTFNGTYSQTDNVPMTYHEWNLYLVNERGKNELLKSTGKVYNANLDFYYDGFKNLQNYQIEFNVETEYGIVASTGLLSFSVTYDTIEYLQKPTATVLENKNAIQVDWASPTSFEPATINNNKYEGIVLQTNNYNSFYIDKNLDIIDLDNVPEGYIMADSLEVYLNPKEGTQTPLVIKENILNYNKNTGLVTLFGEQDLSDVQIGNKYEIIGQEKVSMEGVEILKDVPYLNSNSADTHSSSIEYQSEIYREGMAIYPDEYNLTMQFKPDKNFFFGVNDTYNDMVEIARFKSSRSDDAKNITIFAHDYNICAVRPHEKPNGETLIETFPASTKNTYTEVKLAEPIDVYKTNYIYFLEYGYMEKVIAYDEDTQVATMNKQLPFIPQAGEGYYMLDTLSIPFYTNTNKVFPLQRSAIPAINEDYFWTDAGNIWDDYNTYWVEGGTPIERIAESWWKIQIGNEEIKLEKGGS